MTEILLTVIIFVILEKLKTIKNQEWVLFVLLYVPMPVISISKMQFTRVISQLY